MNFLEKNLDEVSYSFRTKIDQNNELINTLSLLFNKKIYLRNDPLIQVLNTSEKLTNGKFHTDRFMQYSLMLLLEDVSENQTHMEYCKKSHKRDKFDFIIHKIVLIQFVLIK